ncbi:MAG: carbohydrate kinase family protein, partial [Oscillospiraceae bacterium]|nr:carbohydrate kinase family protein [Oscillospiraceae bacterium]
IEALLPYADYLIPSEEFALGHTGCSSAEEAAKELYRRYSPRLVVITQGKKGGILFDGKDLVTYPAFPVEAVDSNGAGDVFHGAFAAALCKGYAPAECCRFASASSALKCTKVGARDGAPTLEQLQAFLQTIE